MRLKQVTNTFINLLIIDVTEEDHCCIISHSYSANPNEWRPVSNLGQKYHARKHLLGVNLINQAITIINALTAEGGWPSTFQRTKQVTNQSQPAMQCNDAKIPDLSFSILP